MSENSENISSCVVISTSGKCMKDAENAMVALRNAITDCKEDIAISILHANPDLVKNIDECGSTLLHYATGIYDLYSVVECILKLGGNPNAIKKNGNTALMRTIRHNLPKSCKVLLDYGADPNIICEIDRTTALIIAAHYDRIDLCFLLISHGADLMLSVDSITALGIFGKYEASHAVRENCRAKLLHAFEKAKDNVN